MFFRNLHNPFKKRNTLESSKKNDINKIYKIFGSQEEVKPEEESNIKVLILSSQDIALITAKKLTLLNSSTLKEISSCELNLNTNERILSVVECDNQLEIISYNRDPYAIKIIFYDIQSQNTKEQIYPLIGNPESMYDVPVSIFHVNNAYMLNFLNKVEFRKKTDFSLIHEEELNLPVPTSINKLIALSDKEFICASDFSILRWKKGDAGYVINKHFTHDTHVTHMLYYQNNLIYTVRYDNTDRIWIYDMKRERVQSSDITPAIQQLSFMEPLVAVHSEKHIELWDLKSYPSDSILKTLDIIQLDNPFEGSISLLNNLMLLKWDSKQHTLELLKFPKFKAYYHKLDETLAQNCPSLSADLEGLIKEYTLDAELFNLQLSETSNPNPKTSP